MTTHENTLEKQLEAMVFNLLLKEKNYQDCCQGLEVVVCNSPEDQDTKVIINGKTKKGISMISSVDNELCLANGWRNKLEEIAGYLVNNYSRNLKDTVTNFSTDVDEIEIEEEQ